MKTRNMLYAIMASTVISTAAMTGAYADAQEAHVITGNTNNTLSGADIDPSQNITLTVKKTGKNPYDDDQSGATRVANVPFSLHRVEGVNVLDDATRKKVMETYSYDYIKDNNMSVARVKEAVTDSNGVVTFDGLKPGLYILKQVGSKNTPEVIMLPTVDAQGMYFEYDTMIVTKNIPSTPPPPPETTTPPPPETTTPPPPETTTPPETTAPPTQTPPPTNETPIFPGGPTVNTGGAALPSLTGEGNMSILTMLLALLGISGAGVATNRVMNSRLKVEED